MKDKRLKLWGAADIGEGYVSTVTNTYFSMFLTDVAYLPLGIVSVVMMLTSIFDFIAAPVAGGIIATSKPMKWGRLRSWLMVMPPITTLAFVICFFPLSSPVLSAVTITLGFCVARGAYNITWASNLSLINVISKTPDTRTKLTSQRMAGFNIGKLASGYITPLLVAAFAVYVGERYSYTIVIFLSCLVLAAGYTVHFFISAGYEKQNTIQREPAEKGIGLKEIGIALISNPQLLITVCIDLTSNMGSFLLPALATYYYKYVAMDVELMALHMLLTGFGGLVGSLLIRSFGGRIRDHRKFLLCVYPLVAFLLFGCRFVAGTPIMFMILNIMCQTLIGTTQPLELQLYMDNVTYHKYKTGVDANSFIMSMSNMPVKFATILKSVIIPFVLMTAGYVAGAEPTPELQQGIVDAYTIIPSIIPLLGFILLKFFYKLKKEDIQRMKSEMETEKC